MSLEELREQNIRLVTEKALDCFIKKGHKQHARIGDRGRRGADGAVGIPILCHEERHCHRGGVLLLGARKGAHRPRAGAASQLRHGNDRHRADKHHSQQLRRAAVRRPGGHTLLAGRGGRAVQRRQRTPTLSTARRSASRRTWDRWRSRCGAAADGTVDPKANIKELYYNAYDSILGMMQRLTVGVPSVNELDARERLRAMCDMFTREFSAKQ